MMGYKVVAVCGSHNEQLVKSYGADEVVDYHDAEKAKSEIQRITGGVTIGLDTVSGGSFDIAVGGFKAGEKGRLNTILPASPDFQALHPNIEIVFTVAYVLLGKAFDSVSQRVSAFLPATTSFCCVGGFNNKVYAFRD
jgi:NADPH:quinone reductase-like Zn-dependent oxidoreductase